MQLEEYVSLAGYTTFATGGSARYFTRASSFEEVTEAIGWAKERHMPLLVLGGGSNMLVTEAGFDGLALKIEIGGISFEAHEDGTVLVAGAGESWDRVVAEAAARGLWGIENLSGIPGTIGAAPVQNIGAYGSELADTLLWVEAYNSARGEIETLFPETCAFGYRTSIFKQHPGVYVVLRVALKLSSVANPKLHYKDLAQAFEANTAPSLGAVRETVLSIRAKKFPNLSIEGTAGSFFLNPVITQERADMLAQTYPALPQYPAAHGVKVSLAWLLDNALGLKGFAIGHARLFEKQPIVVVLARGGEAKEVLALKDVVQKKVFDVLGIAIETEVQIILNKK